MEKKLYRITLFDENLKATEDAVYIDVNRIIRMHLAQRKYFEPSIIEGAPQKEVVKKSLEITVDEKTTGSEQIPTGFNKDGNPNKFETRKYERNTVIYVLDEKEIDNLLSLVSIN